MPRTTDTKKHISPRKHAAVRIDDITLARLEALRSRLSTDWHDATISDILRAVIYSGLSVLERKYAAELKEKQSSPQDSSSET